MNMYNIEAEVHMKLKNGSYRVKVKILDDNISMYVNGNVVFQPSEKHSDWFVATPKAFGARIVEFNGKSPLWKEYKAACIEATQEYVRHEELDSTDNMKEFEDKSAEDFQKEMKDQLDKIFPD